MLVDNGYPVDKNLLGRQQVGRLDGWIGPGPDARSNNVKRLNDDDESFGKSNKQPVLSVDLLLQAAQW